MHIEKIKKYLTSKINVSFIKIFDDSKLHSDSKNTNKFTHIKIIIISDDFIGKNLINRHRIIFQYLKEIEKERIYSMTLYTYTLKEWEEKKNKEFNSTKCIKNKLTYKKQ
ncbi:BolA family protein [Buchnera aphidicola]|uniref:BolA family protein n=1 Tax=Buchnera aphidicola TaxID=9 RepID=UPI0034646782